MTDTATASSTTTETLTVRDNRTGVEYDVPILDGTIRAADIGKIRTGDDTPGLAVYDPGFVNTASCRSAVTFIDGEKGILEYRGYPIEQLAEKSTYLEVAYLLIHGHLPTKQQYDSWVHEITYHTFVHENVRNFMEGFRYDAHPMGMLLASVGALSNNADLFSLSFVLPDHLTRIEAKARVVWRSAPVENNRRARFYSVTKAGRKQLDAEVAKWERLSAGVNLVLQRT